MGWEGGGTVRDPVLPPSPFCVFLEYFKYHALQVLAVTLGLVRQIRGYH